MFRLPQALRPWSAPRYLPSPTTHRYLSTSTSDLSGLHAIVTGASRGIGLSIAQLLASRGASLTLISRSAASLDSAHSSLPNPSQHHVLAGDVSSRSFWNELKLDKNERVDLLVNSAGISHQSLYLRTSEDLIENVVQTNLMGTMWACKSVGRKMLRQRSLAEDGKDGDGAGGEKDKVRRAIGRGVIVNVASLLGVHGGLGSAAYAASKAGVVGFTRALAAELGPSGIRVNTVLPGYVSTDMTDGKCFFIKWLVHHIFWATILVCSRPAHPLASPIYVFSQVDSLIYTRLNRKFVSKSQNASADACIHCSHEP